MFTRMKKVFFYKRKGFLTDAFIVTLGTIAAQVLPLIFYPVLTRLFSPADFGILATITAITGVLTVIVTGKYETIVLIVDDKKDTAGFPVASYVAVCADQYGASDDNRTQRVVF